MLNSVESSGDYVPPQFRAVVLSDRLQVNPWHPAIASISSEEGCQLRAAGIAVADLWVEETARQRELVIAWLVRPPEGTPHPNALLEWARCVGYRRMWFPEGAPLELDRADGPLEPRVRCEWCNWEPGELEMSVWLRIQACGTLPSKCNRCGSEMPQWLMTAGVSRS